ncbi:hypothetical protein IU501_34805 [Nocardia otitidiscaviarum]|uniref:hypothetical protein n=1 Tax=Nocardia otitidiscaviarum TaxID=1823 RepID=UPI001894A1DD|nr:hypothetical protein [Nocardia otitidiscaviarum]MBF6138142.1 hypothetical protein [Nocardia otitidiscaviarum]
MFGLDDQQIAQISQQENVQAVARMIEQLYAMPDCGTGGPIHCVVDDTNVEDESLEVWHPEEHGFEPHTPEVMAHAQAVLDALRPLSLQERAVATVIADV